VDRQRGNADVVWPIKDVVGKLSTSLSIPGRMYGTLTSTGWQIIQCGDIWQVAL